MKNFLEPQLSTVHQTHAYSHMAAKHQRHEAHKYSIKINKNYAKNIKIKVVIS